MANDYMRRIQVQCKDIRSCRLEAHSICALYSTGLTLHLQAALSASKRLSHGSGAPLGGQSDLKPYDGELQGEGFKLVLQDLAISAVATSRSFA